MEGTLLIIGKDGPDVVNPDPLPHGTDGPPLVDGNGKPGKYAWFHCKKNATPGQPGNGGNMPLPADSGGNADSAYALTLVCDEFVGSAMVLVNQGGNGGKGGDGGRGGKGSDGGDAGDQPAGCHTLIPGGPGGGSGQGGRPGNGGDAGSAGDVNIVYGPGISGSPISVDASSGTEGKPGTAGGAGTPGKGGRNSDGTYADDGPGGGSGPVGHSGNSGYGGSQAIKTDPDAPSRSLRISILPHTHDAGSI